MVLRSVRATVARASSGRPITLGTMSPATIAMMTSTTIISISVTPASGWRAGRGAGRHRAARTGTWTLHQTVFSTCAAILT